MSDFDREAERERLREQFEADKRKREQSERMSELLLKGATMTNKHCDRCGDPVFRWDGQEFCPTCQGDPGGEPTDATGDAAGGDLEAETAGEPDVAEPQPGPSDEGTPAAGPSASPPEAGTPPAPEPSDEESAPSGNAGRQPDHEASTAPTNTAPEPARPATGSTEPAGTDARDDVAAARAALARTLASLSARAESADDLSSTREYLAAAREAAEALDAAERAGR